MNDFCVFILTHGRVDDIHTISSLKKCGYSGKVVLIIDNEDSQERDYLKKYKDVEVFDKKKTALSFDEGDNFNDRRSIVYARNACFEIAKKLGYKYFMQMDDDYTVFEYRLYSSENQKPKRIKNLDAVFSLLLDFYKKTPFKSISIAQGGDFIGGKQNVFAKSPTIRRKCMNSFICSTDRPFKFIGRINEDVNTYTYKQSIGCLMGTIPLATLVQKTTQSNSGGMTDLYLDGGTYVKSFYSVMFQPSSVKVKPMGDTHMRLHHSVKWDSTIPKILSEELKLK